MTGSKIGTGQPTPLQCDLSSYSGTRNPWRYRDMYWMALQPALKPRQLLPVTFLSHNGSGAEPGAGGCSSPGHRDSRVRAKPAVHRNAPPEAGHRVKRYHIKWISKPVSFIHTVRSGSAYSHGHHLQCWHLRSGRGTWRWVGPSTYCSCTRGSIQ